MAYKVFVDSGALEEMHEAKIFYNKRVTRLGIRFVKEVRKAINSLKVDALIYMVRYREVRCMLLVKFPFMVHYTIDEINNRVIVHAVFHTNRDLDNKIKYEA
jgi:ParE toxin of type II toxin-antitoxin system, parDE